MSRFFFEISVSALYSVAAPTLEVLVDGVVQDSVLVTTKNGMGLDVFSFSYEYGGTAPSSLALRFNDGSGEAGRSITIDTLRINGQVLSGSYIGALIFGNGQSSAID